MRRWVVGSVVLAMVVLGVALGASGQGGKSQEALERAAQDYLKSGLLLAGEGREEEAVKSFRQALAIKPQWAEAHSLLGSALARLGTFREAEEELRKAVALKPDYAEGWNYLGIFLKERGKEQEAQEAFRKAKQYQH